MSKVPLFEHLTWFRMADSEYRAVIFFCLNTLPCWSLVDTVGLCVHEFSQPSMMPLLVYASNAFFFFFKCNFLFIYLGFFTHAMDDC